MTGSPKKPRPIALSLGTVPVHELLVRRLDELQMSQEALGETVGVSQAFISHLCTGNALPSPEVAIKIEKAIGFKAGQFRDAAVRQAAAAVALRWAEAGVAG